jgi:hypothetical protein
LDSLGATPATPNGSPLGFHSYDPGIAAGSLVMWGTPFPEGSGKVDIDEATAELLVHNVCVFDAFTVPNSFDPTHALGIFSAIINSMKIEWSGVTRSVLGFKDATNKFRGDFFECSAKIAVSATTPKDTGHGFHFESDPATTHTNFAQFGTEHNGMFF